MFNPSTGDSNFTNWSSGRECLELKQITFKNLLVHKVTEER